MAKMPDLIHVQYCLVIFPVATFKRCGDVSLLTVLGFPVYKQVDRVKSLFGFAWGSNAS